MMQVNTKKTKLLLLLTLVLAVFYFTSCDSSVFHSESLQIKNDQWKANDTLFYSFVSKDSTAFYDFYFNVRNTTDYDQQNLYLFITAFYPGDTYSRDTAECILAAPDGKWYGKGMGKHKDNKFLFRKNVRFRKNGKYIIAVNQAMRFETLKGISDVGIIIKKTE